VADDSCGLPRFLLVGTLDDREVTVWNPVVYGKRMREKTGGKLASYSMLKVKAAINCLALDRIFSSLRSPHE
jgi:hypothetical protein